MNAVADWFAFRLLPKYARQRRARDNILATWLELELPKAQRETFLERLDAIFPVQEQDAPDDTDDAWEKEIASRYERLSRPRKDIIDELFAKLLCQQLLHLVFQATDDQLAAVERLLVDTWVEIFLRRIRFGYLSAQETTDMITLLQETLSDFAAACFRMGIEPPVECGLPAESSIPAQARAMFEVMFLVIPARKFLTYIDRRMRRLGYAR
jgi:hypothetical protein